MTKKYSKYGAVGSNAYSSPSQINQLNQKLPNDKQQALYQELKSSGSVDNPAGYTKTHLEAGIKDEM